MPDVWHDLIQDPDDLPEHTGTYIGALRLKGLQQCYAVVHYDAETQYWSLPGGLVAWAHIKPYGGY